MAVLLDEHTQFVDEGGKPLVNGQIFIGVFDQDPELNPEPVFADAALTIPLENPQTIGALGRSENKIHLEGLYSIKVVNSSGSQNLLSLQNGSVTSATGPVTLTSVLGENDITAVAVTTIASYVDKQEYRLTILSTNTGPVTLNIDEIGVIDVLTPSGSPLPPGALFPGFDLNVTFNSNLAESRFQADNLEVYPQKQGESVVSAATTDIWQGDGATKTVTGDTQIDTFADAPYVGAKVEIIFSESLTLKNGLGITLQGGQDIVTEAGDRFDVYADTVSSFSGVYHREDGNLVGQVTTSEIEDGAITNAKMANNSVDTAQLQSNSVSLAKMQDNSVDTPELVALSVTTEKLDTDSVTLAKMDNNSVGNGQLLSNSVRTPEIQAGAVTNVKIDEYEEGTWTPVLSDGTNDATMDGFTAGRYVRMGSNVTIYGFIGTTNLGSVSGILEIDGLPFTPSSIESAIAIGQAGAFNITAGESIAGAINQGNSIILLYLWNSASGNTNLQSTEWSSNGFAQFTGSYFIG